MVVFPGFASRCRTGFLVRVFLRGEEGRLCYSLSDGALQKAIALKVEKGGNMNIEHLREFEYLAENLSFRDTARHFFVSPSVISRHVSAMEDELGTKLFVRSKQSVAITEAGTVFLDRSKAILSEYNAALAEMSRLDEGGKPVVRLGYLHNAARPFILQFTSYLKEHYPEIEIEFKGMPYKMLYTALDDNRADLNIMLNVYSPHQQRYELATMYRDQFCVVVRANSRLARDCADGIELSRLVGLDLLLPSEKDFPGLQERMRKVLETEPSLLMERARSFRDVDSMYIQVETSNSVGISTSANWAYGSSKVVYLPIKGVDAGIDVNAYIGRSLSGRTLTACKEALASCQAYLEDFSVLENARVQWRARVSALY